MPLSSPRRRLRVLTLLAALAVASCGRSTPDVPDPDPPTPEARAAGAWLEEHCGLAQTWLAEAAEPPSARTPAYGDLTLAFGLARLGRRDASRRLLARASEALGGADEAHQFLLSAYDYRIRQALAGKPHAGKLPARLQESLTRLDRLAGYVADRLRKHSAILEPDQRINPYRQWGARINDFERSLAELADLADSAEVVRRVEQLLADTPAEGHERRARVLQAGLESAPAVGEAFARRMVTLAIPAYDSLPRSGDPAELAARGTLLDRALFAAARFGMAEQVRSLAARVERLLAEGKGGTAFPALDGAVGQCSRALRKLGMRDEAGRLAERVADVVLGGKEVGAVDFRVKGGSARLRALLHAAATEPVLQAARRVLLEGDPLLAREQTLLACAYVRALGQAPAKAARERLEEVLKSLKGVKDTYTTSTHFSSSRLEILEAVVLTVIGEE